MSTGDLPTGWARIISGPDQVTHIISSGVPSKPDAKVFKLTPAAYHSVWLYVMTGLAYPQSNNRFEQIIPRSNLQLLTDKDPQVWTDLQNAFVTIHTHCDDFNQNSMTSWVSMTQNVIAYCNDALGAFEGQDNLTANLTLLVSEKYKAPEGGVEPVHDQAFKDAVTIIQDICDDLKDKAQAYADDCHKHIAKVEAFRNETMTDKVNVDSLDFRFNSTKDEKNNPRECYMDLINKDIARLRDDEKREAEIAESARQEYLYDVNVAASSPSYAWIFPFGTMAAIGVGIAYAVKAREAESRRADAEAQIVKDFEQERALTVLSNWVSHMGATVKSLDNRMTDAVTAMTSIKDMFLEQAEGFREIASNLGSADKAFQKDWLLRRRVLDKFEKCVEEWKEIKVLAQLFLDSSSPVITGVNSSSCVGNLTDLPDGARAPGH
jgi:hypothetical protein